MTTQIIEGIWEDVAKNAEALKGKRVRLTVYGDDFRAANDRALDVNRNVAERQRDMRATPENETSRLLREGREGKMYDK